MADGGLNWLGGTLLEKPAFGLTLLAAASGFIGIIYGYAFMAYYRINLFDFVAIEDFILISLKNPVTVPYVIGYFMTWQFWLMRFSKSESYGFFAILWSLVLKYLAPVFLFLGMPVFMAVLDATGQAGASLNSNRFASVHILDKSADKGVEKIEDASLLFNLSRYVFLEQDDRILIFERKNVVRFERGVGEGYCISNDKALLEMFNNEC